MNRIVGALSRRSSGATMSRASSFLRGSSKYARTLTTVASTQPSRLPLAACSTRSAWVRETGSVTPSYMRMFSSEPPHVKLGMPALSPTMTHGNLVKWFKKEGDEIVAGDVLAEVETDKASLEWDSQEDGYLAKILIAEGTSDVPLGTVCALIAEDKGDIEAVAAIQVDSAPAAAAAEPTTAAPAPTPTPASTPAPTPTPTLTPAAPVTSTGGRVVASPLAKTEAAAKGIDLAQVSGTGPNNRVIAADVREFIPGVVDSSATAATGGASSAASVVVGGQAPSSAGDYTDIPNNGITKVAAQRLTEAKQTIPHFYLTVDVKIDDLLALRRDLNAESNGDYKISVNDFVVKASALSMRHVPEVNSQWGQDAIRRFHNVDISVAVDTDHGLQTPIIFDAEAKGLAAINNDVKELAALAKDKKLKPDQFMGGTFTISNLGMFGVKQFCAIINPPQSAILAVGAAETRPTEDDWAQVMTVTLSCDHRVIDGATGARWLQHFKKYMENPTKMLL